MRCFCGLILVAFVGLLVCPVVWGQRLEPGWMQTTQSSEVVQPATSVSEVLAGMAARAGVVFVGRVEGVEHEGGVVVVRFRMERAIQGELGSQYSMREWAGWWAAGQQRYRVGERAMVFLHAPSVGGLSSPVDGMQGIVPVIPMGADAEPLLDVRWLRTRVLRQVGSPMVDADEAISVADAVEVIRHRSDPVPVGVGGSDAQR